MAVGDHLVQAIGGNELWMGIRYCVTDPLLWAELKNCYTVWLSSVWEYSGTSLTGLS